MDALNMSHVLADPVADIGHGVKLSSQDEIASKTLVCFLDGGGKFHFGFSYKNGSNLRVACWEDGSYIKKTIPKGAFVISFKDVVTEKKIEPKGKDKDKVKVFIENDFVFPWLTNANKETVKKELEALIDKQDEMSEVIDGIAGLTIQQLDEVVKKIHELKGNN